MHHGLAVELRRAAEEAQDDVPRVEGGNAFGALLASTARSGPPVA
jgi:hypothetical protein